MIKIILTFIYGSQPFNVLNCLFYLMYEINIRMIFFRYVLAKMEEESEEDPHGHITSLAVRRSHR